MHQSNHFADVEAGDQRDRDARFARAAGATGYITRAAHSFNPPRGGNAIAVEVKRILLARALAPRPVVVLVGGHDRAQDYAPLTDLRA